MDEYIYISETIKVLITETVKSLLTNTKVYFQKNIKRDRPRLYSISSSQETQIYYASWPT